MQLSIIIVSYNVKYFLEHCLCSVRKASDLEWGKDAGRECEVIVVDNYSSDQTIEYLKPKFPFVRFIRNDENIGFARANNQALQLVNGKYVLFLNPDTIIPEDCFSKCLAFMDAHPQAGALGVRMVDGRGRFLRESKRGFPSPWAAFSKMIGLAALFPKSAFYARYYLGHLNSSQTHVVDALAGAFMFCKKTVLEKTKGFDEQFFMYAEDLDLSYRMQRAGFKNYYYPGCTIIHFKGESTKKDFRYVKLFYKAMGQFANKHFRGRFADLWITLLDAAIGMRGAIAATERFVISKWPFHENNPYPTKTLIVGDDALTEKFKHELHENRDFVEELYEAEEIIWCIDEEDNGYARFIEMLRTNQFPKRTRIYATGCGAIISSDSKDKKGEIITVY